MKISDMRRDYESSGLRRSDLHADPLVQFETWFDEAHSAGVADANALALASVGPDGQPGLRTVLLKDVSNGGFVFFTNYDSNKGRALQAHPQATMLFHWRELNRQVIVEGRVQQVSEAESAAYFSSRPRGSQLSAWASRQSAEIDSRDTLEQQLADVSARFGDGPIPLPPFWGGFRLMPERIEFWQGRPNRLHDRLAYQRSDNHWVVHRLQP
ncbi:pyridoxamine 5'-phosphate oxidase [Alcanivorax sp. JB21]|uniref:pyridoxamine 5'-phosphate oxidase n=1 Tax=Alcanivorax limicola TaxID=2874102 RepID=UPI001CC1553C|nr:pyridoxamine 5'-phosphate oxidase [Alcanivorax limicola]MBZ2188954.1 pyridoxamine 5'-phosphate oxidase [Alcanivorax limicola]